MDRVNHLKVGDIAPDFVVPTLDGKQVHLADFKGKYVLLIFWYAECGSLAADRANLQAVYDAYGADPRFAMIGLSLDRDIQMPREYAQINGLKWMQGFAARPSHDRLDNLYGQPLNGQWDSSWFILLLNGNWSPERVLEIAPGASTWLISPDGRVLARDLVGQSIKDAVGKELAR